MKNQKKPTKGESNDRPLIKVQASEAELKLYRQSLVADWSQQTFHKVLSLLRRLIATSTKRLTNSWIDVLRNDIPHRHRKAIHREVIDKINRLQMMDRLSVWEPSLPGMPDPDSFPDRSQSRLPWIDKAETTWTLLILQTLARLEGEIGLFRDAQSLLFLNAVHYLLPLLKQKGLSPEHDCLVNALYAHCWMAWKEQPEHQFHLLSLLADYLGDHERSLTLEEQSLRLTPIEDHSYLSRASSYWSKLLEHGEEEKALQFLLALYRNCPQGYLEEISAMIRDTPRNISMSVR